MAAPSGERNGQSKLSDSEVTNIVLRRLKGERQVDLSNELNIPANTIHQYETGRRRTNAYFKALEAYSKLK